MAKPTETPQVCRAVALAMGCHGMPWDAMGCHMGSHSFNEGNEGVPSIQPDREENAAEIYKDPAELRWHRFLDS